MSDKLKSSRRCKPVWALVGKKTMNYVARAVVAFYRNEEGGTIVSLTIAVLALGVLIGYATNMASETIERERVQHAADALAYSSGVWLARGMNTACSINHVLGERTGFAVAVDALAGPETRFDPCKEEAEMTKRLKSNNLALSLKLWAPDPDASEEEEVEKMIANFTDDYFAYPTQYRAGAAVYDAKMNLKYYATDCLNNKAIATWLMVTEPVLTEIQFLNPIGKTIHKTESFVLGMDLGLNVPILSDLSDLLGDAADSLDFHKELTNLGDQVDKLGNTISDIGKEIGKVSDSIDDIKKEIAKVENTLEKIDVDVSKIEDLLDSVQSNIDGANSRMQNIGKNLGVDASRLSSAGRSVSQVSNSISSARKELNTVRTTISAAARGATRSVQQALSKVTSALDSVSSAFEKVGENISQMGDMLKEFGGQIASAQKMLQDMQEMTNPSNMIYGLAKSIGISNIESERKILVQLEKDLGDEGSKGAHYVRYDLYNNVEKIQKRFAEIVGSDKQSPEDRLLYRKIYETSEKLKEAYSVGEGENNKIDGFAECVVAPLDTLVPNASEFSTDFHKRPYTFAEKEKLGDLYKSGVWDRFRSSLNPVTNTGGYFVTYLFTYQQPEREEQFQTWIQNHRALDVGTVCNHECIEAFEDYNREIDAINQNFEDLRTQAKYLQEKVENFNENSAKETLVSSVQFLTDVALDVGEYLVMKKIEKALKGAKWVSGAPLSENQINGIIGKINGCVRNIISGAIEAGITPEQFRQNCYNRQRESMIKSGLDVASDISILADGTPVGVLLDEAIADWMNFGVDIYSDFYKAGGFINSKDARDRAFKEATNRLIRSYLQDWEDLWSRMGNLQKPICQTAECSSAEENSIEADRTRNKPLLPVLGEVKVVLGEGSNYLQNCKNQAWTTSPYSASPYDDLPELPWTGTDENKLVPTIQQTIRYITYGATGAVAGALAYYIATLQWPKAAFAGGILSELIALQTLGIDSDWKPGEYGHKNNPSVWSYPCKQFDYDSEKYSQWVRATYPVVDTLRSGLRKRYQKDVPISNLSTYLTAWAYRYTLSESYYLRTGDERPYRSGNANYVIGFPCYLYVIAGLNAEKKGQETYWSNSDVLDQMFSVCAIVRSTPREAVAGPRVFPRLGSKDGITAAAQTTFYPSNGRNTTSDGKLADSETATPKTNVELKPDCQPYTAWDSLQWKNQNPGAEPIIWAPEWWNSEPSKGSKAWDYLEMTASNPLDALESSKMELSWEAMLSPVTRSRLEAFEQDSRAGEAIKRAAKHAAEHFETICN